MDVTREVYEYYGIDRFDRGEYDGRRDRLEEVRQELAWFEALEELLNEAPDDFYPKMTDLLYHEAGNRASKLRIDIEQGDY